MFTGIVEATAKVLANRAPPGRPAKGPSQTQRLVLLAGLNIRTVPMGGSIAVNGVCLTLVAKRGRRFEAILGPETLAITTLGSLQAGDRVHLERPLVTGAPLGGHLVAGHADGTGRVVATEKHGDALELRIAAPAGLRPHLVSKGSVTVDGVSLTINKVRGLSFWVMLIPHTLHATCLGERRKGDRVNIEADLISKHIAHLVKHRVRR